MEFEKDQEVITHVCKFCSKSFSCGRSLGGHMRCHHDHVKINDHDHDHDEIDAATTTKVKKEEGCCSEGYYGLRENPKKTWRVLTDSSNDHEQDPFIVDVVLDKLCEKCGKGFQSWKALFGHMKCHSEKERVSSSSKKNKNISFELDEQEDSSCVQKKMVLDSVSDDNEATVPNRRRRSKRKLRTRYMNMNSSSSSSSCFVENSVCEIDEHEQKEVAMSLMMLSRDVRSWCGLNSIAESSDNNNNNSLELEAPLTHLVSKIEGKKRVITNGSEIVKMTKKEKNFEFGNLNSKGKKSSELFVTMKKTKVSDIENGKDKKKNKKKKIEVQVDSDSAFEVNAKSKSGNTTTKYTSMKEKFFDCELSKKKPHKRGKFECTTCNKIFNSYQALGGHRASHKKNKGCYFASKKIHSSENENIAELELEMKNNLAAADERRMLQSEIHEEAPEIRDFLDLNVPAEATDEEKRGHGEACYKPWWFVGSNLKQEAMV
ncbi:uncharacterized protein [Cicer arietinum]|uniref:Uncharacterized protein LOC101495666 n=1 Tax=Cicer arietinum TaxID=3827 RepID=A0A1S2Y6C0_CICAR|nr:uncharacterized protein LOC101495666 [Cicer arietinum]